MIEIIDFKDIQGQIPNTYGYISLGGFKFPDKFKESIYIQSGYYKVTCKVGEKTIDLIVVQTGYFSDSAIVLGDLTNIPGEFLIDQEELYTSLKDKIEKLNPKVEDFLDVDRYGVFGFQGTTSTAASSIINNLTCQIDYVTKS